MDSFTVAYFLVCLASLWALQLWVSLAELLTTNHSFIFSPRGCQRSSIVLVVKSELSPNPHHEHIGHKIKITPKRNKAPQKRLRIIGSKPSSSERLFFVWTCFLQCCYVWICKIWCDGLHMQLTSVSFSVSDMNAMGRKESTWWKSFNTLLTHYNAGVWLIHITGFHRK